MRKKWRSRPILESLDGRLLLSGYSSSVPILRTATSVSILRTATVTIVAPLQVALQGSITGKLRSNISNPDAGHSYRVNATGAVQPVGTVGATGSLQSPGFIATGVSTGSIKLTSRHGLLRLGLTGDPQAGFSTLPSTFHYTIMGGTGRFKGATGTGTAALTMQSTNSTPTGPGMHTGGGSTSRFTMTFAASTTPAEPFTATSTPAEPFTATSVAINPLA
jgi:hypothetical protein